MTDNGNDKTTQSVSNTTTHGGPRPGAGRPPLGRPGRARTMRFVATDAEWTLFNTLLPADARDRFETLFLAALSTGHGVDMTAEDDKVVTDLIEARESGETEDGDGLV